MDYLGWRLPFIAIAILCWTGYIVYQSRMAPGVFHYWGFRTGNFTGVMRKVLPLGLIAVAAFIVIGLYRSTIHITWHIIPILILYPVWGTIQQFLLIALTAGNLDDYTRPRPRKGIIVLLSAILFAAVHFPYLWLMIATFILSIFYCLIYLSERNLYVLGLFHGWLGAVFYYAVLERDPFVETFGKIFSIQN
ncbi:MAG TPA: CPBP family intramembrane glutamic endopeptidase [Flavisolibacter sp.]|nr:CPBP family intramembrane glutamic endopeptidase [Flavisolibacter sp.]HWJ91016.1 CPBP family intramembrane glutamic endopeptidase [Flavisolibacter sp.]